MNIGARLQQAALQDVEAGGIRFRVRRINSASLVNIGRPMMLMAAGAVQDGAAVGGIEGLIGEIWGQLQAAGGLEALVPVLRAALQDPARRARLLGTLGGVLRDPQAIAKFLEFLEAAAVAGVVQASEDGESWEKLRLVLDVAQEDGAANRLHTSSLPPGVVETLGWSVLALSLDGGAARERLAHFRGSDPR